MPRLEVLRPGEKKGRSATTAGLPLCIFCPSPACTRKNMTRLKGAFCHSRLQFATAHRSGDDFLSRILLYDPWSGRDGSRVLELLRPMIPAVSGGP